VFQQARTDGFDLWYPDGDMTSTLLEVRGLSKVYSRPFSPVGLALRCVDGVLAAFGRVAPANLRAVEDLSFTVHAGGIVGFLGPNGAGKTTTLKMLVGFLRPTSGAVFLFGSQLADDYRGIFRRLGGLIDKPCFYDYLSGWDNLCLKRHLYPDVSADRLTELLELVGVADAAHRPVGTYSTGMQQRLALAAAMLHRPELLILDEPTRGLDPKGQAEVRAVLKRIRDAGETTILLSSHLLHEVEQICDKVVIIDRGRHIHSGDVASLLQGEHEAVRVVVADPEAAVRLLREDPDVAFVERAGSGRDAFLRVGARRGGAGRIARILVEGGIELLELTPVRRSLEEFFLKVTTGDDDGRHPQG